MFFILNLILITAFDYPINSRSNGWLIGDFLNIESPAIFIILVFIFEMIEELCQVQNHSLNISKYI
jgi:hypothetical protein